MLVSRGGGIGDLGAQAAILLRGKPKLIRQVTLQEDPPPLGGKQVSFQEASTRGAAGRVAVVRLLPDPSRADGTMDCTPSKVK